MACFDVAPLHLPGGTLPNQSQRNLTDLRVEIWTLDILNKKLDVNHYNETTEKSYGWIHISRSESKERFALQRYLLIIGKKQNMQVL